MRPVVATATVVAPPTSAARAGSPNWSTVAGQDATGRAYSIFLSLLHTHTLVLANHQHTTSQTRTTSQNTYKQSTLATNTNLLAAAFPQLGGKADTSKKTFGAAVAAQPDQRNGAVPAPPKPAFSQAVTGGLSQQQPPPVQRVPAAAPAAPAPTDAAVPAGPPAALQSDLETRFAEVMNSPYLNFGVEDSVSAAQSPWGTPAQNLQLLNACASYVGSAHCNLLVLMPIV